MIDKLHLTLTNRVLKAMENLYSGESIAVELTHAELTGLTAADYRLVLFGADKTILAASVPFTASGDTWTTTIDTASEAFQSYYETVSANSAKTLGMMVVSDTTGDTLCAGTISVTSVPFPSQMSAVPDLYADGFVRESQVETIVADAVETAGASKVDKVSGATAGNAPALQADGGLADSGVKLQRHVTEDQYGNALTSIGVGGVSGVEQYADSVAIGGRETAIDGDNAVVIGANASATAGTVSIGEEAWAEPNSVAIGYTASSEDSQAVIVGEAASAVCGSTGAVAVGEAANVDSSENGTAIGHNASVYGAANAVQLGAGQNETEGSLQFRTFPLMDAQGRIASPAISGKVYSGQGGVNTYIVDGRAFANLYFLHDTNAGQACSFIFNYSSLSGDMTDRILLYYQGAPSALTLTFKTAGVDDEAEADIKDCNLIGETIDWTRTESGDYLLLALITDCNVGPDVICLAKYERELPY